MTDHDVIYRFRLRLLALAEELGNVRAACRQLGVHHSTYYRYRRQAERFGLDILRPRERRRPQMPNQIPRLIEQRVIAFSLAHPGLGPDRIAAELRRDRWGGFRLSPNGVWRILRRAGMNTRAKRLAIVAGHAAPPEPVRPTEPERHLHAPHPGYLVQFDCFFIGRLSGTKGTVWQYTAIDVASAYVWAELHQTPRNPDARFTGRLAARLAAELAERGHPMERAMCDNGSEFRAARFCDAVRALGATPVFIHAGRPQTNGAVERVQQTILEECWKPAFARALVPKITGLRRELELYLTEYNNERAHTGRRNRGRTPHEVLGQAKMWAG